MNSQSRIYSLRLLAAAALAGQSLLPPTLAAQNREDTTVPVVPARRATTAAPSAPPALLPGADRVTPMTLQVAIRRGAVGGRPTPAVIHQTILRTADRVHISAVGGSEWLFERNTLDGRRASASLIDHRARTIVFHDESDLRNVLGIRGWSQVLALGFDPDRLATLEPSGQTRRIGGLRFTRYLAPGKGGATEEVWWSSEDLFPSRFVTTDGTQSTQFTVERFATGVDPAILRPPAIRFPAYQSIDLAEWLER